MGGRGERRTHSCGCRCCQPSHGVPASGPARASSSPQSPAHHNRGVSPRCLQSHTNRTAAHASTYRERVATRRHCALQVRDDSRQASAGRKHVGAVTTIVIALGLQASTTTGAAAYSVTVFGVIHTTSVVVSKRRRRVHTATVIVAAALRRRCVGSFGGTCLHSSQRRHELRRRRHGRHRVPQLARLLLPGALLLAPALARGCGRGRGRRSLAARRQRHRRRGRQRCTASVGASAGATAASTSTAASQQQRRVSVRRAALRWVGQQQPGLGKAAGTTAAAAAAATRTGRVLHAAGAKRRAWLVPQRGAAGTGPGALQSSTAAGGALVAAAGWRAWGVAARAGRGATLG